MAGGDTSASGTVLCSLLARYRLYNIGVDDVNYSRTMRFQRMVWRSDKLATLNAIHKLNWQVTTF
jgi:hypothetical protein